MIAGRELLRILQFLAVGVLNTVIGLGTIYLCKWLGGMNDVAANATGYAVGLVNSFVCNRRWTFSDAGPVLPAMARFFLAFLVSYALNLATVLVAIHGLGVNSYLAHAIGTVPYTACFYLGSRWFVFRTALYKHLRNLRAPRESGDSSPVVAAEPSSSAPYMRALATRMPR